MSRQPTRDEQKDKAKNFEPPDPKKMDDKGRPLRPWRKAGDGCERCGPTQTTQTILQQQPSPQIPDLSAPGGRTMFVQRRVQLTCNACKKSEVKDVSFKLFPHAPGGPMESWDD